MCGVCWVVRGHSLLSVQFSLLDNPPSTPPPFPLAGAHANDHVDGSLCYQYGWKNNDESKADMIPPSIIEALQRRGPDSLGIASLTTTTATTLPEDPPIAQIAAAVLHIRGDSGVATRQPIMDEQLGDLLCWNGEIFGGLQGFDETLNDGLQLFNALAQCNGNASDIRSVIGSLEGPFAIMFWSAKLQTMFVSRDRMGRRSLVFQFPSAAAAQTGVDDELKELASGGFCISSVAASRNDETRSRGIWKEFPVSGIFEFNFSSSKLVTISLTPWDTFIAPMQAKFIEDTSQAALFKLMFDSRLNISPYDTPPSLGRDNATVDKFLEVLGESVSKRVLCISRIKSENDQAKIGVLYSGGIDSLLIAALADKFVPAGEPIDLMNLAFGVNAGSAPDRQTGINGFLELKRINPSRRWNFIEINILVDDVDASRKRVEQLLHPSSTVMDFNIGSALWHAARGMGLTEDDYSKYEHIESAATRYAAQDTDKKEDQKETEVLTLLAKGEEKKSSKMEYLSGARILLSGLGADELLGGYGRHRTAYRKGGIEGLREEMSKDVCRIWRRNLGRDDRLMSDHGREVRFPFLDEGFMKYILSCNVDDLLDLSKPPGIGDKKILRDAAHRLGIDKKFASLEKRAIQFGTKIANKNVAGYVPLTDDIRTSEIVQSAETVQIVTKGKINKKANKRNGKPGFE
eukprot:TRINITY_DN9031_c0_g1_i1.p1 TRINITY_DN9031_c0_g1~~TRINITY_DN9031_c0_g1_i1.p1  ORF type:complete len:688 (+),score=165.00 TRINITY_DN9031_c0_g1_i1:234-2297(+)